MSINRRITVGGRKKSGCEEESIIILGQEPEPEPEPPKAAKVTREPRPKDWAYAPGTDRSEWKLPLHTDTHVRMAIAHFDDADIPPPFRHAVALKIANRARQFGVELHGDWADSYSYYSPPAPLTENVAFGVSSATWPTIDITAAIPHRASSTQLGQNNDSMTFSKFFQTLGMHIEKDIVACGGCQTAGTFDADFQKKTIQCLHCGRITSFELFEKEQK